MSRPLLFDRSPAPSPEPNPDGPLPNPPWRSKGVKPASDTRATRSSSSKLSKSAPNAKASPTPEIDASETSSNASSTSTPSAIPNERQLSLRSSSARPTGSSTHCRLLKSGRESSNATTSSKSSSGRPSGMSPQASSGVQPSSTGENRSTRATVHSSSSGSSATPSAPSPNLLEPSPRSGRSRSVETERTDRFMTPPLPLPGDRCGWRMPMPTIPGARRCRNKNRPPIPAGGNLMQVRRCEGRNGHIFVCDMHRAIHTVGHRAEIFRFLFHRKYFISMPYFGSK